MIGYRKDGSVHEFQIGCSLMGDQFTRIELTNDDFRRIHEISKSHLEQRSFIEWLGTLHCRLAPKAYECYFTDGCDGKIVRSHSWESYCTKCNKGGK